MSTVHVTGVDTMRAMVQDRYGPPEVLRLDTIPVPASLAKRQVLVRVGAAGVSRAAWHLMTGHPSLVRLVEGLPRPRQRVPGVELAGTVVAVGAAVARFSPGDRVFGVGRGAFAEYAVAAEGKLATLPTTLTKEQAAAVPDSGTTALQALRDAARVEPGQHVLITGASGGVGSYAVQLAKALGAEVTAVSSPGKLDLVRSLGADHTIDYTREHFAETGRRYDAIIDLAGNPSLRELRRALTPRGVVVIAGGEGGGRLVGGIDRQLRAVLLSPFVRQRLRMFTAVVRHRDLDRLAELIDSGAVTPAVERTYSLPETAEALRRLQDGRVRGKVVVRVES